MEDDNSIPDSASQQADAVLFRSSKKRKFYRQRAAEPSQTPASELPTASAPIPSTLDDLVSQASNKDSTEVEGAVVPMSEILRLRKLRKGRGGVEFKAEHAKRGDEDEVAIGESEEQEEENGAAKAVRRFAPQTGTIGDVNKHM
jgi:hypothetical protein